jgi:hypothetical protein
VPLRGLLARSSRWLGILCLGVLAVLGGLGLAPAGRVAVGVAGLLAAVIAVGVTRDLPRADRRPPLESAVQAAAWTVGGLLVLAGVAALVGGVVAVLVGAVAIGTWLVVHATRPPTRADRPGRSSAPVSWPWTGTEVRLLPVPPETPVGSGDPSRLPTLSTPELGREWIRTTAALGGRLSPVERQALVRRREETLDELERRDPAGFARWLAAGPAPGTDPADYVQGRPMEGDAAAGTDAA